MNKPTIEDIIEDAVVGSIMAYNIQAVGHPDADIKYIIKCIIERVFERIALEINK